jgi:hypothetical protein
MSGKMERIVRITQVTAQDRARFRRARERGRSRDAFAVVGAHYDRRRDVIALRFRDGGEMMIPRRIVPGLEAAHASALRLIELSPAGDALSWPKLDLHVSVPGLVERAFGARFVASATERASKTKGKRGRKRAEWGEHYALRSSKVQRISTRDLEPKLLRRSRHAVVSAGSRRRRHRNLKSVGVGEDLWVT